MGKDKVFRTTVTKNYVEPESYNRLIKTSQSDFSQKVGLNHEDIRVYVQPAEFSYNDNPFSDSENTETFATLGRADKLFTPMATPNTVLSFFFELDDSKVFYKR